MHLVYIVILFGLAICGRQPWSLPLIAFLMLLGGFNYSCFFVALSTEMLALARPGNQTMAVAFCNTFNYCGWTISRLGTAVVLGSGILASQWSFAGINFCAFQSIFLFFACFITLCLVALILVPSIIPVHNDYYNPYDADTSGDKWRRAVKQARRARGETLGNSGAETKPPDGCRH